MKSPPLVNSSFTTFYSYYRTEEGPGWKQGNQPYHSCPRLPSTTKSICILYDILLCKINIFSYESYSNWWQQSNHWSSSPLLGFYSIFSYNSGDPFKCTSWPQPPSHILRRTKLFKQMAVILIFLILSLCVNALSLVRVGLQV